MCEAPAFHQGPRPFTLERQARSGRNPKLLAEHVGSKIGRKTWCKAGALRQAPSASVVMPSTPAAPLVAEHPTIGQPHVLAFHNTLHKRVVPRFRSPGCRRAYFSTPSALGQLPAAALAQGPVARASASTTRIEIICPTLGILCSGLRRRFRPPRPSLQLLRPLLASDRASRRLSVAVAGRPAPDQISPSMAHPISRLCLSDKGYIPLLPFTP